MQVVSGHQLSHLGWRERLRKQIIFHKFLNTFYSSFLYKKKFHRLSNYLSIFFSKLEKNTVLFRVHPKVGETNSNYQKNQNSLAIEFSLLYGKGDIYKSVRKII
jgi:hypothetical protein